MNVFLLGLLFVMVVPLAEGALFALLLREVYIRHPLPLGGAIVSEWWKSPDPPAPLAVPAESREPAEALEPPVESGEFTESVSAEAAESDTDLGASPAEVPPPDGISHFGSAATIPTDLPVHSTIEAMTSAFTADVPDEFERLIEESATAENARVIEDELNYEDLEALAEALPGKKIDFSQEIEADSHVSEPISPTAKEVLGENFDFQALEQELQQQFEEATESGQQTAEQSEPPHPSSSVDSAKMTLDVQEDESGTVQVSSPVMLNVVSPFASDFAEPQRVFPTFSNDVLYESSSTAESMTGDLAQFCFSEESRPMFTRKTRK